MDIPRTSMKLLKQFLELLLLTFFLLTSSYHIRLLVIYRVSDDTDTVGRGLQAVSDPTTLHFFYFYFFYFYFFVNFSNLYESESDPNG